METSSLPRTLDYLVRNQGGDRGSFPLTSIPYEYQRLHVMQRLSSNYVYEIDLTTITMLG